MTAGPLRVATVITRLAGGAGVLALRGAVALDPATHRVAVITGSGALLPDAEAAGLEVIVEPALRAPISPAHDLLALHRLTTLLRRRRFDVVHTHCSKAGALGRIAARRAGVGRIVHTYHGFGFHEFQSGFRRRAYVEIERGLGRITDLALCVGSGVAVEALRRGLLAPDRIRTTGVAVDHDAPTRTARARRRARQRLGLAPTDLVVGSVGRLTYQKAPEDFVAALRALNRPGVVGVWIGDGELAEPMRARIAESGARVVLAGERDDVAELLPAFDVFALPSRYEGLPLAIVEAMVCGVPVVATAVNAVGDVVAPGETGLLVPPGRPELLAASIAHLLDSPGVADRLAVAARARIDGRHRIEALAGTLVEAYGAR
ncbi:Glycosyltransferase involved in cell wall bisynthesis [Saccharopolyspora shandongensis]|uniref:Glycosyltransferase involved in cell wall bisynthesis n=1 Tax=Saccharopolyspora shandongensis TaxID=418495 RepID=A0A1H3NW07_9PSEU|nr:glycosyltransferase [Saccharopolyspora shandongensis]SDY92873.1 Glycosyltransferase involved in cell wall bisynthesis [Saccharopolyspora shandongensis]